MDDAADRAPAMPEPPRDGAALSRAGGTAAALAAFFLWGVLPVYWKELQGVPPLQVIAHRVAWSLLFLAAVAAWRGGFGAWKAALRSPAVAGLHFASGLLLSANWLTYVWAVSTAQIVEASLGYFLNPLLNVLLGCVALRERLRPVQWAAVALAAAGVALQVAGLGRLPWIALVLAGSFAVYGFVRKRSPLGPLSGLGVETTLVFPLAAGFIAWQEAAGAGAFGGAEAGRQALLVGTGVVTAVPLLLFAAGTRALPLAMVGLLQYVAPSVQFALGVMVYDEPFGGLQTASFGLVWAGLALLAADGLRHAARSFRFAGGGRGR